MMQPPSEDIVRVLEDTLGYTLGSDIFISRMPPSPATLVVVTDRPGSNPVLTHGGRADAGSKYEYPSLQFIARTPNYPTGYKKLKNIEDVLHGRQGVVKQGAKYTVIQSQGSVAQLNWDEELERVHLVLNFNLQRTPA